MKRSKYSEEQIAYAIRQAEGGTPVGDVCRQLGISEAPFYIRKKTFAHLGAAELRRMRQIEEENARLKGVVADLTLDKGILQETLRKYREASQATRAGPVDQRDVSRLRGSRVSLGWLFSDRVVSTQSREGPKRAPAPPARVGACPAALRL